MAYTCEDDRPYRRFAAALLLRAWRDWQGGDHKAGAWLTGPEGREWFDLLGYSDVDGPAAVRVLEALGARLGLGSEAGTSTYATARGAHAIRAALG